MARKNMSPHQEMLDAKRRRDTQILRRYAKGETMESIAEYMGMTRQRVGQIIRAAEKKEKVTT